MRYQKFSLAYGLLVMLMTPLTLCFAQEQQVQPFVLQDNLVRVDALMEMADPFMRCSIVASATWR
jgi:hypothetical protein